MSYFVYKIANTVNTKLYVGCTIDIAMRWQGHQADARRGVDRPLYRDMREYGIECFSIEQLQECFYEQAMFKREIYWMRILNTIHPYGYNLQAAKVTEVERYVIRFDIWKWPVERYANFFGVHANRVHQIQSKLGTPSSFAKSCELAAKQKPWQAQEKEN
jgi:GIY-YIG catalytic domain